MNFFANNTSGTRENSISILVEVTDFIILINKGNFHRQRV